MAQKPSPNSLIHCSQCGEDYSATYKKCPFCGTKNDPQPSDTDRPASSSDLEDTYVFDGQDLFDDAEDENDAPTPSRGGKRLAGKASSSPFANAADINWPRVITFICSLIIIVAAMIIVFTVVYPQLRGNPVANNSQPPSFSVTNPGSDTTQDPDPSAAVSDPDATGPGAEPSDNVPPSVPAGLTAIAFSRGERDADFTLTPGESHTLTLVFTPASWSGDVTWTSSNTNIATVDANGKVTNVNTTGGLRRVVITASAGGLSLESIVYCRSTAAATDPPASNAPSSDPPASDPPATPSPSGSGVITVGSKGVIANTGAGRGSGVYVRKEPNTNNKTSTGEDNKIASLFNGDPITVLEDAGNGWYKISYSGSAGKGSEGYIKGDYISTD